MAMTIQDHIKEIRDEIVLCQRQHDLLYNESVNLHIIKGNDNNVDAATVEERIAHNDVEHKRNIKRLTQLARTLEFWQNAERTFNSNFSIEKLMTL